MLKKTILLLISFLFVQLFYSCSGVSSAGSNNVVATKWTKADSEVITNSIVNALLLTEWNRDFTTKRKPKLIIGAVENLTGTKIDTELLSKNIERSFINSGKVTFILSKPKREIIRNNRKLRSNFDADKELKKYLKPLNADFFIYGNIKLKIDSVSVPIQRKFQLTLEVIKTKDLKSVSTMSEIIIK